MKDLEKIRQQLFDYLNSNDLKIEYYERLSKALALLNNVIDNMKESLQK